MSPYRRPAEVGKDLVVRKRRSWFKTLGWRLASWWAIPLQRPRSPLCGHPQGVKPFRSRRQWNSDRCDVCGKAWVCS